MSVRTASSASAWLGRRRGAGRFTDAAAFLVAMSFMAYVSSAWEVWRWIVVVALPSVAGTLKSSLVHAISFHKPARQSSLA
jgi:hypothetical protein